MKVDTSVPATSSGSRIKPDRPTEQAETAQDKNQESGIRTQSQDKAVFSFYKQPGGNEAEDFGLYTLLRNIKDKEKNEKKDIRNVTVKTDYDTSAVYNMVARSGTKAGVKAAMSEAHRRIQALGSATAFGDSADRIRAKRAIASLQKLLARGGRKIRQLEKETLLKVRQRRAHEREEIKREQQAAIERQQERKRRHRMDSALVEEGKSAHRYQEYEYECQKYRDSIMPAYSAAPAVIQTDAVITPEGMPAAEGQAADAAGK